VPDDTPFVTLPKARARDRVGRNDPCPCGSKRKYKKCCESRDREEHYVPVLTPQTIRRLGPDEIDELRFKAEELDDSALETLLLKLFGFRMYDQLTSTLSCLPYRESFDRYLLALMEVYLFTDNTTQLDRVRSIHEYDEDDLPNLIRIHDAVQEDFDALTSLEEYARDHLTTPAVSDIGTVLLLSGYPALAALVFRGAFAVAVGVACGSIDSTNRKAAALMEYTERMLSRSLKAAGRDPDPFSDVIGAALDAVMEMGHSRFSEQFSSKRRDEAVQDLKRQIDMLRSQIESQDEEIPKPPPAPEPAKPSVDAQQIRSLRDKLKRVEAMLKERNEERRTLRQNLDEAETKITTLEAAVADQDEEEDEAVLADHHTGTQPPRLPVLSDDFKESMSKVPAPVFSSAMKVIGRLAAGHEPTFHQATRTKLDRDAWRYRIGVYRLMFTVNGTIEVHDLIHRRELERWLHKHYHKK